MAIKIIIDSSSDISVSQAQELGVIMMPMQIAFGEEVYYDGVDLTPNDFYYKLALGGVLPKTSQITPFRFSEVVEELVNEGHEVIIITISSKLSATYNNAVSVCNSFPGKAYAVDSLNATSGERVLCLYALDLIKQGYSCKEVVDKLNEMKEKIVVLASIDTLEYLKKGGRISATTALAGELLSIKPIIGVVDGEVKMISKAIGLRRAYQVLDKLIVENEPDYSLPYCFIYSGVVDTNLRKYLELSNLKDQFDIKEINQIGSTIGTHIGSGATGIVYFKK